MSWTRIKRIAGAVITLIGLIGLVTVPEDLTKWGLLAASLGERLPWLVPTVVGLLLFFIPDPPSLRRNGSSAPATVEAPTVPSPLKGIGKSEASAPSEAPEVAEPVSAPRRGPEAPTDSRVFVEATPEELTQFYKDHIEIKAAKLAQPYIDKWIRVSGEMHDAWSDAKGGVRASIKKDDPFHWIFFLAVPSAESVDWFSVRKRGAQLTAVGQIKRIGMHELALENCELVDQP